MSNLLDFRIHIVDIGQWRKDRKIGELDKEGVGKSRKDRRTGRSRKDRRTG